MPECFKSFEHALSVLNLSGNALVDTTEMSGFKALKKLHMGRNDISIGQVSLIALIANHSPNPTLNSTHHHPLP